jgi:hypothetical protein
VGIAMAAYYLLKGEVFILLPLEMTRHICFLYTTSHKKRTVEGGSE